METNKVNITDEEEEKQRGHSRVEPTQWLTEHLLSTESNMNSSNSGNKDNSNIDRYRSVTPHLNYLLEPNRELHSQLQPTHSIILPHSPSLLPLLPSATTSLNPLTQKLTSNSNMNSLNNAQTEAGPLIVSNVLERAVVPFTGPSSALITKNQNYSNVKANVNVGGANKGALSLIRRPICPTCLRPFPTSSDYVNDDSSVNTSSESISDDIESENEHRQYLLEMEKSDEATDKRRRSSSNSKLGNAYNKERNVLQYKTGRESSHLPLSRNERRRRRRLHSLPVFMPSSHEYFEEPEEEEETEYLPHHHHHHHRSNSRKRRYHRDLSEPQEYNQRFRKSNNSQYGEVQPYNNNGGSGDLIPRPFSPHYFRALAHFIPLAITDKAMPSYVNKSENKQFNNHHHSNTSSLLQEKEELEEQRVIPHKQHRQPIYNYVSPLSLIDRHSDSSNGDNSNNEKQEELEEEEEDETTETNSMRHHTTHNLTTNSTFPQSPIRRSVNYGEDVGIEWNDSNSNATSLEEEEEKLEHGREFELPNLRQTMPFVEKNQKSTHDNKLESSELSPENNATKGMPNVPQQNNLPTMSPTPTISGPSSFAPRGYYAHYFVEIQKLGSGTYGGVFLCQHVVEGIPLGLFAVKKIPVGDNSAYLQNVLREVRILEEVKRHPNVIEYNHSWVEEAQLADFGPPVRCLFILMEYATEGSLDVYLERHGTSLSNAAVWYFFLSAVAGTAHLHGKQILHRDLKPQNLLLTGPRGKPPRVLVSDFGTAALLDDFSYERTGGTGTLEYMAPELLETLEYASPLVSAHGSTSFISAQATLKTETNKNKARNTDNDMDVKTESKNTITSPNSNESNDVKSKFKERYLHHHEKASDVWSLGMILYYLMCDATLPTQLPGGNVVFSNIHASSPFQRPAEMIELMKAMLHKDPKRRPSCDDILRSPMAQQIIRSLNVATSSSSTTASSFSTSTAAAAAAAYTGRSNNNNVNKMHHFHQPRSALSPRQLLHHIHQSNLEKNKPYLSSSSDESNSSEEEEEEDNEIRHNVHENNHKGKKTVFGEEFANRVNMKEWTSANDAHKSKLKRKIVKIRKGKEALQNSRVELIGTVTGSSETLTKNKIEEEEELEEEKKKNQRANQPLLLQYTTPTPIPPPTQATSQNKNISVDNHDQQQQQESITTSPSFSPMSLEAMSPLLQHDLNDLSVSHSQDEANSEIRTQRQGKRHRVYTSHPQVASAGNSRNFLFAEGTNVTVAQLNQTHRRQYVDGGVQTDEGNIKEVQ